MRGALVTDMIYIDGMPLPPEFPLKLPCIGCAVQWLRRWARKPRVPTFIPPLALFRGAFSLQ